MSFKVVRDAQNRVVSFGPNEDWYEPGQSYLIEDDEPTITTGPKEELAKLDSDYALTQRNIRDFILLTVEALKLGQPVDLSQVRGVSVVAAVEAQAAALRSQL